MLHFLKHIQFNEYKPNYGVEKTVHGAATSHFVCHCRSSNAVLRQLVSPPALETADGKCVLWIKECSPLKLEGKSIRRLGPQKWSIRWPKYSPLYMQVLSSQAFYGRLK